MKQILTLTQWETRIADCFAQSRIYASTQTLHLERLDRVVNTEVNRKHGKRAVYPTWVKGFVCGFAGACDAAMMRNDIEFCYIVDGVMYSVRDNSTHLTTGHYCDVVNPETGGAVLCQDDTARGLFWRGTDKRFY